MINIQTIREAFNVLANTITVVMAIGAVITLVTIAVNELRKHKVR